MTQNEYVSPQILDCLHFTQIISPGEEIFLRTVKNYEIDINLTGERVMWLDGVPYDITPGSVVCRVPGQLAGTVGNINMYILTLDFAHRFADDLPADHGRTLFSYADGVLPSAPQPTVSSYYWNTLPVIFQPLHSAELIRMYERLSLIWRQPEKKEETDALLAAILHLLLSDAFMNRIAMENEDSPVSSVISYIQENYAHKITLDELASVAALNRSYFIRLFKKEMGVTPIEYLNHIRLSAAKKLLVNSKAPMKVIADQCGYESPAYFVSRFHLAFGLTPEAFRNQNRDREH